MTLIAFATYGDHAELITDTTAYSAGGRDFAQTTKHLTLNHIDAVIATQGDHLFAIEAKAGLMAASSMIPTFDALIEEVPDNLRQLWKHLEMDRGEVSHEASIYLIGHSPAAGEFVAVRFLKEHDFAAEFVSGLHVTPSPFTMRPQQFELDRAGNLIPDDVRATWLSRPDPQPPADLAAWGDLGLLVRYQRAVASNPIKVFVGGKLVHTRIERDLVQTIVLTEYDDEGEEFDQMVAGTRHPRSQHGPCQCKSGKTLLECCELPYLDDPCGCGKPGSEDNSFRECCMAPAPDEPASAGAR